MVRLSTIGNGRGKEPEMYAPEWVEKAALLDHVIGMGERARWMTHGKDPGRMVLSDHRTAFPDGDVMVATPFARNLSGQPLSDDARAALLVIKGDYALWADIADLVGVEACQKAKDRIDALLAAGAFPEGEEGNGR